MSEMLGNYYFLTSKFQPACKELELALSKDRTNKAIQKKLILCYISLGLFNKGFLLYHALVKADINFIVNDGNYDKTCPCTDILDTFEKTIYSNISETENQIIRGILWSYRDIKVSLEYFNLINSGETKIKEITRIISEYISASN